MVPGRRQPSVRSIPSNVLITSILPDTTAYSARSPPSWTANSPAHRCRSAHVCARCSSSSSGSVENSGIARMSSIVSMASSKQAIEVKLGPLGFTSPAWPKEHAQADGSAPGVRSEAGTTPLVFPHRVHQYRSNSYANAYHSCAIDSRQTEPVYDFRMRMFIHWSQFPGLSAAIAFAAHPRQPRSEVRFVPHDTNDGSWPL